MKRILLVMSVLAIACAGQNVAVLNLRDPRLPLEARRWLADAEDEVAVAHARVDDAGKELTELRAYLEHLQRQLDRSLLEGQRGALEEGRQVTAAFRIYAKERLELGAERLEAAKRGLELARARLTLARAETALRYDLAVYELKSIAADNERLRTEVAALERAVEETRTRAEKRADELWQAYSVYAQKGGVTSALWTSPLKVEN